MNKQERLYFILAALPALLSCTRPPADYWGWILLIGGISYQGFLAVKAVRSLPEKPTVANSSTDQPTDQTDTMKTAPKTIASLIVVAAFALAGAALLTGCADANGNRTGSFTGKISTQGSQELTGAINAVQALDGIYNAIGSPGVTPAEAKEIAAGIGAANVINQAYVGQQIPASAIDTGSPVVNAAMIASIVPGAVGTQASANALSAATLPNVKAP